MKKSTKGNGGKGEGRKKQEEGEEAGEKREIWARRSKGQRSVEKKESEGGGRTSSLPTFVNE